MTDADADLLEFVDAVDHRWRETYARPRGNVFHYTSGPTLTDILKSRVLRATASAHLNDQTELTHARDLLLLVLRQKAAHATLPEYKALFEEPVTTFDYAGVKGGTCYVTSFSETEDDLSQWCMYGDAFCGVALEFDVRAFVRLDQLAEATQNVGFFRVEYADSAQLAHMEWLVETWERTFAPYIARAESGACDVLRARAAAFAALATAAVSMLPRMKSRWFHSECEWRLAHRHGPDRDCCSSFETPEGKRYVELLRLDGLPVVAVWLGPAVANDESERKLRLLLDDLGYAAVRIERSQIPLRGKPHVLTFQRRPTSS